MRYDGGMKTINSFREEHFFLSNFFPSTISIDILGKSYVMPTGEHAFHAGKVAVASWSEERKESWLEELAASTEPRRAKYLGRSIRIDVGRWDALSTKVMVRVQDMKFRQNPDLARLLMETDNAELVEGNTWNDKVWGAVNGEGENRLGRILMRLRSQLQAERLIDAAWDMLVQQQNGPDGWTMSQQASSAHLHEAFEPFRSHLGDSYDMNKIREAWRVTSELE